MRYNNKMECARKKRKVDFILPETHRVKIFTDSKKEISEDLEEVKKDIKKLVVKQKRMEEKYNKIFEKQQDILNLCNQIISSIANEKEEYEIEEQVSKLNLNSDCNYIS